MTMAKKTKKQKLMAVARRQHSQFVPGAPKISTVQTDVKVEAQAVKNPPFHSITSEEVEIKKYFLKDLKKSLILIAVIIFFEIGLFALRVNGAFSTFLSK